MIARSLEDNIPEPLAHVQAEAARRIGGTRPRSLLDTRRDLITATGSRRWRCSGRLRGGIGEIGRRVVSGRADGNDRIDTAVAAERRALDDALETDGGQQVAVEVRVVEAVHPDLVRAGARQGREDEEDDEQAGQSGS